MRRSTRLVGREGQTIPDTPSYPDGPPASDYERFIAKLNLESFPSDIYARVDDVVVYSMFTAKKNLTYSRRLLLQPALNDAGSSNRISSTPGLLRSTPQFTNGHASTLYRIQKDIITQEKRTSQEAIGEAVSQIMSSMPDIFKPTDQPTLLHILYSDDSPVVIDKVSFDGGKSVCGGLKAKRVIPSFTAILSTCGSMSNDVLVVDEQSVSAIEGPDNQYPGKRLVLGPFRFGNHDCDPNCQVGRFFDSTPCALSNFPVLMDSKNSCMRYLDPS
ncbi:hypothetical protein H0H81_010245 [Sphagnurus paluster]|uniref:Uncharacterized protein n=1 Tax=Sphagnurus paluster TaxID=117069 RepID=A0A9P7GI35_9AGAR|nr:hypothetical protein H0H81_010245 [Sphagnurus paluster]